MLGRVKAVKDLFPAALLFEALVETRHSDELADAWEEAWGARGCVERGHSQRLIETAQERGKSSRKASRLGPEAMERLLKKS
jgi:hypothetical protein